MISFPITILESYITYPIKDILYKSNRTRENIEVFGLYSTSFSGYDRTRLQYLAPFIKAAGICVKKLKPDIVHADNIPYFLGEEFKYSRKGSTKVLQIIRDFSQFETNKTEAFYNTAWKCLKHRADDL